MTPESLNSYITQKPKFTDELYRLSWGGFGGIDGSLRDYLEKIKRDDFWQDEIGEAVLEMMKIGNGRSNLYAERLIENCQPYLKNPNFNFPQYHKLFGRALRHFGLRAGSYFGLSYGRLFESGVDPEEYYQLVDRAADTGKLFAAWFAYSLPGVIEASGKPNVFLVHAERICRWHGFLPLGKSFLLATAEMLRAGVSIPDFSLQTSKVADIFGKKPASWLVRAMADSAIINYPYQELIEDAQEILKIKGSDKGPSAVGWFASGLMGIEESKKRIRGDITRLEEYLREKPNRYDIRASLEVNRRREQVFDSNHFELSYKEGFLKLLEQKGLAAVTFYSVCAKLGSYEDPKNVDAFLSLPDIIISFRDQVSKAVFSKAMWFVPKITFGAVGVVKLLREIEETAREKGDEVTINAIKYTWGVKKRGESSDHLWFKSPATEREQENIERHIGYFDEDGNYVTSNDDSENDGECPF